MDLHHLDWELLLDPHPSEGIRLGCSRDTPFSRYLGVDKGPAAPITERPRLLLVLANPENLSEYGLASLDTAQVAENLARVLNPLQGRFFYEILGSPATPERIRERLADGRFHALHILAHGQISDRQQTARLVLEDDERQALFTDEKILSDILEGLWDLRLVTLMACHGGVPSGEDPFSGLGPRLVRRGIPAVVAMRQAIEVEAAASFTEHFYAQLVRSGQLDVAVNEARARLRLQAPDDHAWGAPALFMRLSDGRICHESSLESAQPRVKEQDWDGWSSLLTSIHAGRFVPVLGPGMTDHLLPSHADIARRWVADYSYPLGEPINLPKVSQFMLTRDIVPHDELPILLRNHLLNRIDSPGSTGLRYQGLAQITERLGSEFFAQRRDEPHRILADLPIPTYLTTNFDCFMAGALQWSGRKALRVACRWNESVESLDEGDCYKDLAGALDQRLVFHLYGNDEYPGSLVLTEDDHLDFLGLIVKEKYELLPSALLSSLSKSTLLFLGYDVSTLDCRVLFRGLINQLRRKVRQRPRVAVLQLRSDASEREDEVRHFLRQYCRGLNIRVYWGSVEDFLMELRNRWVKEYGES